MKSFRQELIFLSLILGTTIIILIPLTLLAIIKDFGYDLGSYTASYNEAYDLDFWVGRKISGWRILYKSPTDSNVVNRNNDWTVFAEVPEDQVEINLLCCSG